MGHLDLSKPGARSSLSLSTSSTKRWVSGSSFSAAQGHHGIGNASGFGVQHDLLDLAQVLARDVADGVAVQGGSAQELGSRPFRM